VLNVTVDASNVPTRYSVTVLEVCKLYPRQLIFFFRAALTATSLMQRETLPVINTYFTVDCSSTPRSLPWGPPAVRPATLAETAAGLRAGLPRPGSLM